ncbi:MAG: Tex-like N-terminal domain-containing protein, partial [Planctomycetota bacterium]|nr:Tex-like N-terminal domain-containing protein [Planctomycetota bacterium]
MGFTTTIDLGPVAHGLSLPLHSVETVVRLLDSGNTVPFITRYRKDQTGGLDEEHIRQIGERVDRLRLLAERKQTILRSIDGQGKLTPGLAKAIADADSIKRLEDLYLPYKPKKQTLATLARERQLEPLAAEILSADPAALDLDARARDFINPDKGVATGADALLGVGHILAEDFSERADLREKLRKIIKRTGKLVSVRIETEEKKSAEPRPAGEGKANAEKAATESAEGDVAVSVTEQATPENAVDENISVVAVAQEAVAPEAVTPENVDTDESSEPSSTSSSTSPSSGDSSQPTESGEPVEATSESESSPEINADAAAPADGPSTAAAVAPEEVVVGASASSETDATATDAVTVTEAATATDAAKTGGTPP